MCGLFGWVAARPVAQGEAVLARAMDALAHRGPDGRGGWRSGLSNGGEAALGHTRLSLIDAPGGAQPFRSRDGRYVVSFNGEIYNYVALREALLAEGRCFTTRSDTEVLVEAWRTWGEGALRRFEGMFAFALFDTLTEILVLARDGFGEKPLMVAEADGVIAFASEVAALAVLPGVTLRLDRAALPDYLLRRYVPAPETLFEGVRKLAPGALAIIKDGVLKTRRWRAESDTDVRRVSRRDAVEQLSGLFGQSVRLRLRADAPVGVMLSGGLDSSAVAAVARDEVADLRTFSVGFDHGASELPHAAKLAKRLETRHQALTVSAEDFAAAWPRAVRHRGAPVSEASDIPLMLLSDAAARSVKAVLTGDGADELLAGYPKHRAELWTGAYHRLMPPARHAVLIDPLLRRLPYGAGRLKTLSRALGHGDPTARAVLSFASGSAAEVEALCGRRPSLAVGGPAGLSPLRQMLAADQAHWLADNLLERDDRMTMAAGVEARAPFLDSALAAFVAQLPDQLLFDARGGKAILRAAMQSRLPPEILNRRKSGFRTPVGDWFRQGLKPMLRDLLQSQASGVRRMLDAGEIDRRLTEHRARRIDHTAMLWTLANLELFLREHRLDV